MVKVCPACRSTWAGGRVCEDCGGPLVDPFGTEAQALTDGVWGYIRLQYGARRGMLVRVLAILLGPTAGFVLLRQALALPGPWAAVGAAGAVAAGVATWWTIHWAAGKAVRLWVLRRGRLNRRRLARALWRRVAP